MVELVAVQLATETLRDNHERIEWRIYTDSQSAIKAINNPHRQSGQAIIKEILDCVDDINDKHPHLRIKIIWIPGHAKIDGNERADAEAKKAAIHSPTSRSYNHRPLVGTDKNHQGNGEKTMGQGVERKNKNGEST